ncbi:MAG TPA: sigma-70 family RNA polymerase sigma factor [Thermomicrobiales bacterium]|nr:sigma-70 family RNA polymerase sigma factor [Thermomicrobiales bacterium]
MAPPEKPWDIDLTVYQDDRELLAGLRQGEELACTCFMKWYAPSMTRLALRMVGDPDEAEGIVQESFITACAKMDSFRGESALRTWLHRIVVNTALMRLRKRRPERLQIDPSDEGTQLPLMLVNNAEEPLEAVLDRELGDELSQAIMQLPETLRTALVLRDLEELSTREAAEALDISESALKVRLHRARAALREKLSQTAEL